MVKIQKPIPKKLESKPKLDNPIKKKKQQLKKEKSSTKNLKLLDDSTPIKEAKVSLKPGKEVIAKKQNKKDLNGEKKIEKKPLIIAPESPHQKENPKGKKKNKNKDKNGVDAAAKSTDVLEKVNKKEPAFEKPAKSGKKDKNVVKNAVQKAPKVIEVPEKSNKKDPASEKPVKLAKKEKNIVKNGVDKAPKSQEVPEKNNKKDPASEKPAKLSKKGNKLAKNGVENAAKSTEVPEKISKENPASEKPAKLSKRDKKKLLKNGVENATTPTEVPEKANKKAPISEKPAKSDKKIKFAAKTGPAAEQKDKNVAPAPAKSGKKKKNKKSTTQAEPTPAIEKIKKIEKPKVAISKKKKVKIAFKKLAAKGEGQKEKQQSAGTPFRYDPIPYDEERFNTIVNIENIKKIAKALKTTVENEIKTKKSSIFDDYTYFLTVGSFKIPHCPKRMVRLNLSHSLVDKDDDILLVVPDMQRGARADYENTKHHYEDLLRQNGVEGITIMPMNQLRKENGTFEQKRKLCATYDYFLSDGRIISHVGAVLGMFTQKPRNTFHSVRLNDNKNLNSEIEKALKKTAFRQLGKGSMQTIPVGTHKHSAEQIAENVHLVVEQLKTIFPGGLGNIRNLYLRIGLVGTSSLPLYISMGQAPEETPAVLGPREERMLKLKREANEVLSKFTMTKDGKLIKLTKSGVEKKRKLQEMAAALKEGAEEESGKKAKKAKKDSAEGENKSKKKVKEVKELELPENEEGDDDTSDEDDEDAVQLGQGSDDETEDDDMANLDEEDTESGAEIVENGFVGEDDEESEEDDEQAVNQGENDDDDDDDEDEDDDDEDEDEEDESD